MPFVEPAETPRVAIVAALCEQSLVAIFHAADEQHLVVICHAPDGQRLVAIFPAPDGQRLVATAAALLFDHFPVVLSVADSEPDVLSLFFRFLDHVGVAAERVGWLVVELLGQRSVVSAVLADALAPSGLPVGYELDCCSNCVSVV